MYYQQGNSELDQTMESSNIHFNITMLSFEISHLQDQQYRIRSRIAQLQYQYDRISRLQSQNVLQNSQVSHASQYLLTRSLSRSCSFQQQISTHQLGTQKYSVCIRHNQQESVVCFTCKRLKCNLCTIIQCKYHDFYSQQQGLQKMEDEIYLHQASLVEQQVASCEKLMNLLNKKKNQLTQTVEGIFSFLEKRLERKKLQIRSYFEGYIDLGLKEINLSRQQLKDILHHLNQSKRIQPKKFDDLQILQRSIKSRFGLIKQRSKKQQISEAVKNMNFSPSSVQQIQTRIQKIGYRFDLYEKNNYVNMGNLAQGHRKQKLQIVQKKRER